jgi:hypothetical protein
LLLTSVDHLATSLHEVSKSNLITLTQRIPFQSATASILESLEQAIKILVPSKINTEKDLTSITTNNYQQQLQQTICPNPHTTQEGSREPNLQTPCTANIERVEEESAGNEPIIVSASKPSHQQRPQRYPKDPSFKYTARAKHIAYTAVDLDTSGIPLTYASAKRGPDKDRWEQAEAEEFDRLVTESETIKFIPYLSKPKDRKAAYYNPQPRTKIKNGVLTYRIRGTIGGDQVDYPGEVTAKTADLTTLKLLLNSVVSENANWFTADCKDFYLGTTLLRKEYMRIHRKHIPIATQKKYNLEHLFYNEYIMVEVGKGIYGLPQAGKLAQDRLIAHLATHGYHLTPNTPCLFRHDTYPTAFTLVVDDFGIKYAKKEHADHLLNALRELYIMTVDWEGSSYIGIKIDYDKQARTISLSMPNYVKNALKRFNVTTPTHATDSPLLYTPPSYGSKTQQTYVDTSPSLPSEGVKRIQQIVGVFLYYARAVDPTMLTAITKLGSSQARPTEAVLAEAERFLQYAATWPTSYVVYHASDMILHVHSDASYLSESNSRSRAGGLHYLSSSGTAAINGAVDCLSCIIPSVVASAFEAEYAALFLNGQTAAGLRNTLADLGYSQPSTPIVADNLCAVNVVSRKVKQKRSKAIDMRFHWIRDRVDQGQFNVSWKPGYTNLADYFTKAHPVHHFKSMRSTFVMTPQEPARIQSNQSIRHTKYKQKHFISRNINSNLAPV